MFKFKNTNKKDLSIYIHIPFCESRCYYCDFYSSIINEENTIKYFENLKKEILIYSDFLKDKNIKSIFIGGGTPSSVNSKYIKNILKTLKEITNIDINTEITIEVNPNSINEEKLIDYLDSGINRFSMGAQSFNDNILKSIGRVHKKDDIIKAINLFHKYNIENFSFDLMLALPYQQFEDIEESINMIEVLKPAHISYYSLIIEENTLMEKLYENKKSIFADESEDRKMYHYVVNNLEKLGYHQYEISNFAKKDFVSIHNKRYWTLDNYIGFGPSAHSNIDNIRSFNHNNLNDYSNDIEKNKLPILDFEELSKVDRINEFSIMGLRMNTGIDINLANKRFNINFLEYYKKEIEKNINNNLISIQDNFIHLTEKGRDLSNTVEVDFIRLKE